MRMPLALTALLAIDVATAPTDAAADPFDAAAPIDAAAGPPRHALRWTREPGAETCTSADALEAAVETRLGRLVFARAEKPAVIIEGRVSPSWHVGIQVRNADGSAIGERVLDERATDCRALDDALVLVISLIIDPNAALRETPAPAPPREPWHVGVGVSALGAGGILPRASVGGALRVSIEAPRFPVVEVWGTWWVPDETSAHGQGGRFTLITGGVAARIPLWKLDTGFGFQLGRMAGTGIGFDRVQDAHAVVPTVTIDPAVAIPIGPRVSFKAGLSLWLPLVRPRFTFEQSGGDVEVYQPGVVGGVVHAGADVRF
jgi:hypothetical protein